MAQLFTHDQVLSHNSKNDLYLIIRGNVINVSEFADEHPGGGDLLLDLAGQDATEAYDDAGHSDEADEILTDLCVGQLRPAINDMESTKAVGTLNIESKIARPEVKVIEIPREALCSEPINLPVFLIPDSFQETEMITKTVISHNVAMLVQLFRLGKAADDVDICSYRFKLPTTNSVLGLPIGQHISIGASLPQPDGSKKEIIRSYTPISGDDEPGYFDLLIKSYPTGNISKYIGSLDVGDKIRVRGPKGAFIYTPNMVRHFGMVAGGSGITPMLQIIQAVLRGRSKGEKAEIDLIFANVAIQDILLKARLDALAETDSGFRVHYVLDKPPEGWTGGVGYVTADMISKWLPKAAQDVKILLCGPPPMVSGLKKTFENLGFKKAHPVSKLKDQLFAF